MTLSRTAVVANGKGGVGKTSLTANIAGLAAKHGTNTLLIDLDPQGNLRRDLGYPQNDGSDLYEYLRRFDKVGYQPLEPLRNVRERLDVIPGGPDMADMAAVIGSRGTSVTQSLGEPFRRLIDGARTTEGEAYDLVLVDTAPGERILLDGILAVASALVIPTKSDDASIDGVERIAERFAAARQINPQLELAGVVLFGVGTAAKGIEKDMRAALADLLGDAAPVFNSRIRAMETAAVDARANGLLVHELEERVEGEKSQRLTALRSGKKFKGFRARNASGLVDDYTALAEELVTRIVQIESERTQGS